MDTRLAAIIWAAGFFDGEGCSTLSKTRGNSHLRIMVSQKNREPLERFQSAVGTGKIYTLTRGMFLWQTTNELDGRKVMDQLYPYLCSIKQNQYTLAVASSSWHDGHKNQLRCKNPEHAITTLPGKKARICRTCQRQYMREYHRRQKAAA